jgi:hypothetical protein
VTGLGFRRRFFGLQCRHDFRTAAIHFAGSGNTLTGAGLRHIGRRALHRQRYERSKTLILRSARLNPRGRSW